MRPITPYLIGRLRCPNPTVGVIPEAIKYGGSDIRQRKDQWEAADGPPSASDFEFRDDGGLALAATNSAVLDNGTGATYQDGIEARINSGHQEFHCIKVVWGGDEDEDMELQDVRIYMNPNFDGSGALAVWYELHVFAGSSLSGDTGSQITLREICDPVRVLAPATAGDVTFDFSSQAIRPKPKRYSQQNDGPWTYFGLYVLDDTGGFGNNASFAHDEGTPSLTTDGNVLTGVLLHNAEFPISAGRVTETDDAAIPRCRIRTGTYSAATITFSDIDLGSAPSDDVEFLGQGETPGSTSITYEVSDDSGANWYEFTDGMIAVDDLANVAKQQTYYLRATLTPGNGGCSTPVLRYLGAIERTSKFFHLLATVEGGQGSIDPITLKGEISEITIRAIKDGVADYMDAITDLLSQNYLGDVAWRIWIGPLDPEAEPRSAEPDAWMLIDTYLIDDYNVIGGAIELTCVSPMSLLKERLPAFDDDTYSQSEALLQDVYEDIRDGQLGLPARYVGPGPIDTTTRVSKDVTDSDCKVEMDALIAEIGYGHISSQGRLKAVDMYGDKAVVRTFAKEDLKWDVVSPGFRNRIPEFFVPYDYDVASDVFLREVHAEHADALVRLGKARLDPPTTWDTEASKWVRSVSVTSLTSSGTTATANTAHDHGLVDGELVTILGASETEYNVDAAVTVVDADTFTYTFAGSGTSPANGTITVAILPHRIANRVTQHLGPGTILLNFWTQYAYPELEVGDMVSLETDRFVAYDPTTTGRSLRGLVNVRAVIQAIHDTKGTQFTAWVRSYASIVPVTTNGKAPGQMDLTRIYNSSDVVANNPTPNWGELYTCDTEDPDYTDLHDPGTDPEKITIKTAGRYAITAHIVYKDLGTGGTAAVELLGLQASGASGFPFVRVPLDASAPPTGSFDINLVLDLQPGDYCYLEAIEGGTPTFITLVGGSSGTTLQVSRISRNYVPVNSSRRFSGVRFQ